ncbi:starvation protein B [Cardiobacteriaceae bacterium TAE3-ERU3]|nr:starvation protein B [Cardiobacteriaceae bacterium TAE3-ERU3]
MSAASAMTERKPYLLEAIYAWIVDNDCTPHLVIAHPGKGWVSGVPQHLLEDDVLVLNISPQATQSLHIDADACYFETRFQGKACSVSVAMPAIHSLVARENGEGIQFGVEEHVAEGPKADLLESNQKDKKANTKSASHLKIIK